MSLIVKGQTRELVPEGEHTAHVADVRDKVHPQFGPQTEFVFDLETLANEDGSPTRIWESCGRTLSRGTRLARCVEGILGRTLTDEEVNSGFDLEVLLGRRVHIVVKHKCSASGTPYAKVEEVRPIDDPAGRTEAGQSADESYDDCLPF